MQEPVAGLVLAGGRSRRMGGGDKVLLEVAGQSLLARVVERARPQTVALLLNANGDPGRFAAFGMPVVADVVADVAEDGTAGPAGPLAGILTGLEWAHDNLPGVRWMASFAGDTPLLPEDLVDRLLEAVEAEDADIGCAASGGIAHPVFGLWPVRLAPDLRRAFVVEGIRTTQAWMSRYRVAQVGWPAGIADPFLNVNTPEDLARLRLRLADALSERPPSTASLPVAVVVEHVDGTWRPVEVVADPPAGPAWQVLPPGDGRDRGLVGGVTLGLRRTSLAAYRRNLAGASPSLRVVLSRGDGTEPPVTAATVAAEGDAGEPVAMPAAVAEWILDFTARHPPEPPHK
jgi:molybdopterin-guanine dinucleotide biosynthesis protein A